jgi:hypothetical protein
MLPQHAINISQHIKSEDGQSINNWNLKMTISQFKILCFANNICHESNISYKTTGIIGHWSIS